MLSAIPASRRHAYIVAARLREADATEAVALTGESPLRVLLDSYDKSQTRFTLANGRWPVGIGGASPISPGLGLIWLVGTPAMTADYRDFARNTEGMFQGLAARYGTLTNIVSLGNVLHRRWLEWAGCEFHETYIVRNTTFQRFTYNVRLRTSAACAERSRYSGPILCPEVSGHKAGRVPEQAIHRDLEAGTRFVQLPG